MTRKRTKHYGRLGGPHQDKRRKAMYTDRFDDDIEFEELEHTTQCTLCDSLNFDSEAYMGTLGDRKQYRCRYCGTVYSVKLEGSE